MELPTGTVGGLLPVANQNQNGLQAKGMAPIIGIPQKNLFIRLKSKNATALFIVAPNYFGSLGPALVVSCDYYSETIIRCNSTMLAGKSSDLDAGVYYENGYCNVYVKAQNKMNIIPLYIPSSAEYVLQSVDTFPDDVIWSTKV